LKPVILHGVKIYEGCNLSKECGNMDKKGKVLIETFLALFLMCVLTPLAAAAGNFSVTIYENPNVVGVGQTMTVWMAVVNDGDTGINNITCIPSQPDSNGGAVCLSGPVPSMAGNLPNTGDVASFTWTYAALATGNLTFSAFAQGYEDTTNNTITVAAYSFPAIVLTAPPTQAPTYNFTETPTQTPLALPTYTGTPTPPCYLLIDDLEDGDNVNKLSGAWYTYEDSAYGGGGTSYVIPNPPATTYGSTTFYPQAPGYGGTGYAAAMTGVVGTALPYNYIGMGTQLSTIPAGMDITGYASLRFETKGDGRTYRIKLISSSPIFLLGLNDNMYEYTFIAPASWQMMDIPLIAFTQEAGWGTVVSRASALADVTQINIETDGTAGSASVWIDDLSLNGCVVPTMTFSVTPYAGTPTLTPMATLTHTLTATPTAAAPAYSPTLTQTPPMASYTVTPYAGTPTLTPVAPFNPTATSTATQTYSGLPDLAVVSISNMTMYPVPSCVPAGGPYPPLGINVLYANAGTGNAGSFQISVNGITVTAAPLNGGQTAGVWVPGVFNAVPVTVILDNTNIIAESNEANNTRTFGAGVVAMPTQPPTCIASPTPSTDKQGHAQITADTIIDPGKGGKVSIKYDVKDNVNVKITVYDRNGKKVKTLVNSVKAAGAYDINWGGVFEDGKTVSAGVYVIYVKIGNYEHKLKVAVKK
jgi:hypothetical protein